ncbi:glycoside hydrolase family 3 N-terminal domain-containing protein [Thioalkalivibrio sp. XN8]|uniref:glycoside hydrolase family 3 N-terminal domain-containing protein n=1 Tax=Thioalkalivibrio sp. XN8 TaxID=2712863 RepID=UPI0013E9A04D|nr:glycoside hydrolase family 3 N-terminal domain-containing protein [Thioalkalivibrio sp. XN8]NGP54428.1 glycosyl hydrolase [Thioalkalivibrio sp. XN8]
MNASRAYPSGPSEPIEQLVQALLARMTLAEKVGQMCQRNASEGHPPDYLGADLRAGQVGAVLNVVEVDAVNELQRIAVEESRLGIPLLVGRDVIHGFRTVMPLPLGQAASWNPGLVRECARIAAREAAGAGINWTFAPMIDIARDPRWGRIAESFGEDVFLASRLAAAAVTGFQGEDLAAPGSLAACAKHFAGYGAAESGRDYATTSIPEVELRNVYFPPFQAAIEAGVRTLMPSFCELNGVPCSGNEFLLRDVLRGEWGFDGVVVSDWDSVRQLKVHGLTADDRASALAAVTAGLDLEMAGDAYRNHLASLVESGAVEEGLLDQAVAGILRLKFELGLFENPYTDPARLPPLLDDEALATAKQAAAQSAVLLQNRNGVLPLKAGRLQAVAVIGPLADAPHEQLGTWTFDGSAADAVTPRQAIEALAGPEVQLRFAAAMANSRSSAGPGFDEAVAAARDSDVALLFLGEEAILSGEAHSRAEIGLPGAQEELVRRVREAGRPVVAVVMAGRPLTLAGIVDQVDALLFAWHPGTMGGPALAELLFGVQSPSGKLPVTFPRMVGQVPIYYSQKNTGKPPTPDQVVHIDDIDTHAPQTSIGMTAFHLDAGYRPLFPFGFGLSYTEFHYRDIRASAPEIALGESVRISAELSNQGPVAAEEVVQLYVRDLVGSITRPVRELKGFKRLRLAPGQTVTVAFDLHTDELAFHGRDMRRVTEPGEFRAWIGGSSDTELGITFHIRGDTSS